MNAKKVLGFGLATVAAVAATVAIVRHNANGGTEVAADVGGPLIPAKPKMIAQGSAPALRDMRFHAAEGDFVAEGVRVGADGSLTVNGQGNGPALVQRPVGARLVRGTALVEELAAQDDAAGTVNSTEKDDAVRFDDKFGAVDLEYRYNGQAVEEFFHIDNATTKKMIESGADLEVTSEFPTFSERVGAVLMDGPSGAPLFVSESRGENDQKPGPVEHWGDARVRLSSDLEYSLPTAYAVDATGAKKDLKRRFEVKNDHLVATTILDAAWVKTAKAPIAIDPSVIEIGNVDIGNFNGMTNIVRDSTGTLHVVYKQGSRLRYARGDGNTFQVISTIDSGDPCRIDDRTPALVIDSRDVIYLSFTSLVNNTLISPNDNRSRGGCARYSMATTVAAQQLRALWSKCENRCQATGASLAPWTKPLAIAYGHDTGVTEDRPGLVQTGSDGTGAPILETFGNTRCSRDDRYRNFELNVMTVDRSDRIHFGVMKHHDWAFNSFFVTLNPDGTWIRPGCTGAFAMAEAPIYALDELNVSTTRDGNIILLSIPENFHAHHGNIAAANTQFAAPNIAQVKIFDPQTRQFVHNSSNSENPALEFDPRRPAHGAGAETAVPQYLINDRAAITDSNGTLHVFYTIRPTIDDQISPTDWCVNIAKMRHAWFDRTSTPPQFRWETPFSQPTDCGKAEGGTKVYLTRSGKVRVFFHQCVTTPGTGAVAHQGTANGCTGYYAETTPDGPMNTQQGMQRALPTEVESQFQLNPVGQSFPAFAQMIEDYETVYLQRRNSINSLLFYKSAPDVDAARLVAPASHTWVGVASPTFEFGPVVRDLDKNFTYKIEISETPAFTPPLVFESAALQTESFGANIRLTLPIALSDTNASRGIYYWRVVPDKVGDDPPEPQFAAIRELGVDLQAPQPFNLVGPGCPVDSAGNQLDSNCQAQPPPDPVFEWNPALDE
jgi:hypothetical protein